MTNMKKCLLLACAILAVSACAPKSTELKIYDLDAVGFEVTVKMSDIADNLRVVPLESGDDFIVSSETQKWVNDKYILIFGQNAIEQFSAEDGKHIRTLAVKGGGPNEYDYVLSPFVDDERQILYFSKMKGGSAKAIDLNTGSFLPDVDFKVDRVTAAAISSDGRLILPSKENLFDYFDPATGEHEPFYESTDTTDASSKATSLQGVIISSLTNTNFFCNSEELFIIKDTLYLVKEKQLVPYCGFVFKHDDQENDSGSKTTYLNLDYVGDKDIVVSLMDRELNIGKSGGQITSVSVRIDTKRKVIIDRKSGEIKAFDKFIINPSFESESEFASRKVFRGSRYFAAAIEAYNVKDCIDKAIKDGVLSDSQQTELMTLSSRITEDSNPVFVIGRKR